MIKAVLLLLLLQPACLACAALPRIPFPFPGFQRFRSPAARPEQTNYLHLLVAYPLVFHHSRPWCLPCCRAPVFALKILTSTTRMRTCVCWLSHPHSDIMYLSGVVSFFWLFSDIEFYLQTWECETIDRFPIMKLRITYHDQPGAFPKAKLYRSLALTNVGDISGSVACLATLQGKRNSRKWVW